MKNATQELQRATPASGDNRRAATTPAPLLDPGVVLADKYRIESVIGMGGMGVVYSATNVHLDQRVALKMLLASADDETVARFTREARTVAKLQNEHVARVIDLGTAEPYGPFMVLELLEGQDFADLLVSVGRLAIEEAVGYTLEACEAMAEAHSCGVVHRDLKPQNLFLARRTDGTAILKVLDFGISKVAIGPWEASITRTSDVIGSPMYMSPEQLRASRDVDARTDLWSLGITLYELIAGKSPFGSGTVAEVCAAVLTETPKPLCEICSEVPEELSRVIMRCLEKSADKRYADVGELAAALAPFGGDTASGCCERIGRLLGRSERSGIIPAPISSGARQRAIGSDPPQFISAEEAASTAAGLYTPRLLSTARHSKPWRAGAVVAGLALSIAVASLAFFARSAADAGIASASAQPVAREVIATDIVAPEPPVVVAGPAPIEETPVAPSATPHARPATSASTPKAVAKTKSAFADRK